MNNVRRFALAPLAALAISAARSGPLPIAAVAIVLGTATPAFSAAIRDIKDLSISERTTLPADTVVRAGGKTVTLADIRRNHLALDASRRDARNIRIDQLTFHTIPGLQNLKLGSTTSGHGNVPLIATPTGWPYPNDYEAACLNVAATVCIYFPSGVDWYGISSANGIWTYDWQISQGDCAGTGGTWSADSGACEYLYPGAEKLNFVPPATGFKTNTSCTVKPNGEVANLTQDVDPHGYVAVTFIPGSGWGGPIHGSAFAQSEFCFVAVSQ
jgi:hypothetical protein